MLQSWQGLESRLQSANFHQLRHDPEEQSSHNATATLPLPTSVLFAGNEARPEMKEHSLLLADTVPWKANKEPFTGLPAQQKKGSYAAEMARSVRMFIVSSEPLVD